ncbi:hypothetical protein FRB93_004207 [Tulasnella sp. JGI-2019a]|nr:hypothetical protein FRB93_004207 [Tulasnella sp. JGI-2019a]
MEELVNSFWVTANQEYKPDDDIKATLIDTGEAQTTCAFNSDRSECLPPPTQLRADDINPTWLVNSGVQHLPQDRSLERQQHASYSVFLHLPFDVLAEILLQGRKKDFRVPWNMAQVNKGLRTFVIGTPLLWTKIDIMYGLERVASHLERSQDALLDVCATYPPITPYPDGVAAIKQFVELVKPHCHRIQRLEMVFICRVWLEAAFPLIAEPSTRAQILDVGLHNCYGFEEAGASSNKLIKGTDAKGWQPRTLRLRGAPVWDMAGGYGSFWSQVKTFEYLEKHASVTPPSVYYEKFFGWLRCMQVTVESLTLGDFHFEDAASLSEASASELGGRDGCLTLAALLNVKLMRVDALSIQRLWLRLDAPNIQSLTVDFVYPGEYVRAGGKPQSPRFIWLMEMLKSCTQLERLDVTNIQAHGSVWINILENATSLIYLRIANCQLEDHIRLALEYGVLNTYEVRHGDVTRAKVPVQVISHLCPNLQHLVFDNNIDLPLQCVKDIVVSRNQAMKRDIIRTVVVRGIGWEYADEENSRELQKLSIDLVIEAIDQRNDLFEYIPAGLKSSLDKYELTEEISRDGSPARGDPEDFDTSEGDDDSGDDSEDNSDVDSENSEEDDEEEDYSGDSK